MAAAKHIKYFYITSFALFIQLITLSIFWNQNFYDASRQKIVSTSYKRRPDVVILFTQMRSGSSILGELFNQRTDVTYLYEPVFPFDERPCERLYEDRVQVLRHISRCEFFPLPVLYKKAYDVTNRNDIHARWIFFNETVFKKSTFTVLCAYLSYRCYWSLIKNKSNK